MQLGNLKQNMGLLVEKRETNARTYLGFCPELLQLSSAPAYIVTTSDAKNDIVHAKQLQIPLCKSVAAADTQSQTAAVIDGQRDAMTQLQFWKRAHRHDCSHAAKHTHHDCMSKHCSSAYASTNKDHSQESHYKANVMTSISAWQANNLFRLFFVYLMFGWIV